MTGVAERLAAIRNRIAAACERVERDPSEVTLVGASKEQPLEVMRKAHQAGLRTFGENRVHDALEKAETLPGDIEWHCLGALQSNKVRPALDLFRTFHAVDRLKIARLLDREAEVRGFDLAGFLEVNLGREEGKHGFPPHDFPERVEPLAELRHLRLVGLMAIPPLEEDAESMRPWFRRLRELGEELSARAEWRDWPGRLSMGMSLDFEVAVEEGATHVRVGSALFGPRR